MDRLREIAESCQILSPQVGVITSVGEMHLEKLKSLGDIKKAKAELLESLPSNGVAVLNRDDRNVRKIAKKFEGRKIWYGFSSGAGINGDHLKDINLKLLGRGGKYTALAAYAVGRVFKVREREVVEALERVRPAKGRLNLMPGKNGARIIDDTYNAGPRSTSMALEVLRVCGGLLVATSANLSGREPPASFSEVSKEIMRRVDLCIDGGRSLYGIPSTVIRLRRGRPVLLRKGAIPVELLSERLKSYASDKGR